MSFDLYLTVKLFPLTTTQLLLVFIGCVLLTFIFTRLSFSGNLITVPQILQFDDSCQTETGRHADELTIVAYSEGMARNVMNQLCTNDAVNKQFGKVNAFWQPDEREMFEFVGQGSADLILIKDNFIRAFDSDITYGYREIAAYGDYNAYLIGGKEKPRLEKEYLLGKRIGILDYPSSRSGHIAPMRLFKQLGLTKNQVELNYAKSHTQLRTLLATGQVDMISSFWAETDNEMFSPSYRTPLQDQISGSKWYLKAADKNPELKCSIQALLVAMKQDYEGYYSDISLISPCENQLQGTGSP